MHKDIRDVTSLKTCKGRFRSPSGDNIVDGQQLKQMIDRLAREVGFDLVAVSDASEFTDDREKRWSA